MTAFAKVFGKSGFPASRSLFRRIRRRAGHGSRMPQPLERGKRPFVAVAGMCLVTLLIGCRGEVPQSASDAEVPQPGRKRIIILTNGSTPYWDAVAAGAQNAAADLNAADAGYQVVVDRNDFKVEGQLDKLKQYAGSADVAAVGISVTDDNSSAIVDEMRRLREAGIKVITIDSDVDRKTARGARFAYLGTDNIIAGRELGRAARALLPEGGTFACFVGLKGAANAQERTAGFREGAGEGFEQVDYLSDQGDPDTAKKNVRDAYDRNPGLKMFVGIWSYNTPAIVDIVGELTIRDKVKVIGFDADPPSITAIESGQVDVLVVQNPYQMGYQGVVLLKALIENNQASIREVLPDFDAENGDLHDTGLKVVVPDGGSPLSKELFEANTEFLQLSEFKSWLQKYGLRGS